MRGGIKVSHHSHEVLSADEHAQIALEALHDADLDHARQHLTEALAHDPANEDYLVLLDRLLNQCDDPIASTALDESNVYLFDAAIHGHALMRDGQLDEGLSLLTQCMEAGGVWPLVAWVGRVLEPVERVLDVDEQVWLRFTVKLSGLFPGDRIEHEEIVNALTRYVPLFALSASRSSDPFLKTYTGIFVRKIGAHDLALALCEEAYEISPGDMAATGLALVYSSMHMEEQKQAWYEKSVQHAPEQSAARLELGDMLSKQGKFAEALAWYESVLERDPDSEWALANAEAMRYLLAPQEHVHAMLDVLARAHSSGACRHATHTIHMHSTPYLTWLPEPREAILQIARQILEEYDDAERPHVPELVMSAIEAPCAVIVASQIFARAPRIDLCEALQPIDPRHPHNYVTRKLWRYDGYNPLPAISPPEHNATLMLLERYEREPFFLPHVFEQMRLQPLAARPEVTDTLLAAMVHPATETMRGLTPWASHKKRVWLAALLIASLTESDWLGGHRREILFDLVRGCYDWSVGAAIVALGELAMTMPSAASARLDILQELLSMDKVVKSGRSECWLEPWLYTLLRFDELPADARRAFTDLLARQRG